MPSYLDLGLIVIVLISAFLSMVRGFTREVLAIGSWAAAAAAAYFFYPQVMPYTSQLIHKEVIAQAVSAAAVFFVTLIVVSVFTVRLSDAILDSKIGALDRSLGFLFGAARGFLLGVVAFAIFNWLVADKQQPEWVKEARTRPIMIATADRIIQMLPEDTEHTIENWLKNGKVGAGSARACGPARRDAGAKPTPGKARDGLAFRRRSDRQAKDRQNVGQSAAEAEQLIERLSWRRRIARAS
jgi:membrane protein required for colicin V production